jgi:TetR/AcrR family transcriptional regulator, transcriptional repressor for nem operon
MRITKEAAAQNKARIVEAAARLIREKGFDGLGVAEVMKAAGLTHGGFYNHFSSKEELGIAAIRETFDTSIARLERHFAGAGTEEKRIAALNSYIARYLSESTRDNPGRSCPMAALGTDAARYQGAMQEEFARGVERYLAAFAKIVQRGSDAHAEAIAALSTLTGALMLSRACADTDAALSQRILSAVRGALSR